MCFTLSYQEEGWDYSIAPSEDMGECLLALRRADAGSQLRDQQDAETGMS
jgi:hypothetical protein